MFSLPIGIILKNIEIGEWENPLHSFGCNFNDIQDNNNRENAIYGV